MPTKTVLFFLAAGLIVSAQLAIPAHGDGPAVVSQPDPIEWQKPERPAEFREVLKGDAYRLRFDKEAAKIDLAALAKAGQPAAGMEVMLVDPGKPADHFGMKVGDFLTKIDGRQIWGDFRRKNDRPQTLTYVSKDGKSHDVQIQPGPVGVNVRYQWRPEFEYLRGAARGAPWDREVVVAIRMRDTNPDLAETALHHAVAAGLVPDQLIEGVGAEIALEQGRAAAAMDFVWSALVDHRSDRKMQLNPQLLYRVAIANYKLDVAAEVLRDYDGSMTADPDMLGRLASMHRARQEAERCRPAPSEQAANLRRFSLTPILEPANEITAQHLKDFLKDRVSFALSVPSSHFHFLAYKPKTAVRDMEAEFSLTIHPTDNNKSDYGRVVELWFDDQSPNRETSKFIGDAKAPYELYVSFGSEVGNIFQPITLGHSGISGTNFVFEDPSVRLDGKQVIDVRLLRIGGEGEIFINGRRVLYVPIDAGDTNLGFAMKIVGMTVDVKQFRISKLVPKQIVHQAADGGILLKAVDANVHGDPIRYEMDDDKQCIGYWSNQSDWVDWDVQVDKPGKFAVAVSSSCPNDLAGGKYVVTAGPDKTATAEGVVKPTGEWTLFKPEKIGTIEIAKPGRIAIAVKITAKPNSHAMNLRQVELRPE